MQAMPYPLTGRTYLSAPSHLPQAENPGFPQHAHEKQTFRIVKCAEIDRFSANNGRRQGPGMLTGFAKIGLAFSESLLAPGCKLIDDPLIPEQK